MSTRGARLPLSVTSITLALLLLGGCTDAQQPTPVADTSSPSSSATPTPEPTHDPAAIPENRFGLECDSVLAGADLAPIFGVDLPVQPLHYRDLAAMQDGDFDCVWGYSSTSPGAVWVGAAPYGRQAFDDRMAAFVPSDNGIMPTAVSGVGDAAWAMCTSSYRSAEDFLVSCAWALAVEQTWIWVSLVDIPDSEVAITPIDAWQRRADPLPGTLSESVVQKIAEVFRQTSPADVPTLTAAPPGCDVLMDSVALGSQFGLGTPSAPLVDPHYGSIVDSIRGGVHEIASENQGARTCWEEFPSAGLTLLVEVVPRAAWIEKIGQWQGWGSRSCVANEGSSDCELSGYANELAIHVISGGTMAPDGLLEQVFAQIAG